LFLSIQIHESDTENVIKSLFASFFITAIFIFQFAAVNLQALLTRFIKTCLSFSPSVLILRFILFLFSNEILRFLSLYINDNSFITELIIVPVLTGQILRLIFHNFNLVTSSMLSTSTIRLQALLNILSTNPFCFAVNFQNDHSSINEEYHFITVSGVLISCEVIHRKRSFILSKICNFL